MDTTVFTNKVLDHLAQVLNIQSKITSVSKLKSLEEEINNRIEQKSIHAFIASEYMNYEFEIPDGYHSILIMSTPLSDVKIILETSDGEKEMIIPSGYYGQSTVNKVKAALDSYLTTQNIKFKPVHLPLKLLAARTELTKYGKNNISYTKDYGSRHRLYAYLTDLMPTEVTWSEDVKHPNCTSCTICEQACPTGIINKEHFQIDAGRCLTFFNELDSPFPDWIKGSWHNALIGCTKCQNSCPLNFKTDHEHPTEPIAKFTKEQVHAILTEPSYDALNEATKLKINTIEFDAFYPTFRRNFKALYENL